MCDEGESPTRRGSYQFRCIQVPSSKALSSGGGSTVPKFKGFLYQRAVKAAYKDLD